MYWEYRHRLPQVTAAANRDYVQPTTKGNLHDLLEPNEPAAVENSPLITRLAKQQPDMGSVHQSHTTSASYNRSEGLQYSKQLSETLTEFLARLPPSLTHASSIGPWIWVENPHTTLRTTSRDADIATFKTTGRELLEAHLHVRARFEEERAQSKRTLAATTRLIAAERAELETRLRELARTHGMTGGKWMLFVPNTRVDEVWSSVAAATVEGTLGCAAKVATAPDDGHVNKEQAEKERKKGRIESEEGATPLVPVFVYTADCEDAPDVKRTLLRLQDLELLQATTWSNTNSANGRGGSEGGTGGGGTGGEQQRIYYKCDAWTYLDLKSGNPYGIKTSLYSSSEMLEDSRPRQGRSRRLGKWRR